MEQMTKSYCLNDFSRSLGHGFYLCYSDATEQLTMHTHSDYTEIVIVLEGTAIHRVNQEVYFAKRGDVFVIPGDTTHGFEQVNALLVCSIMCDPNKLFDFELDIRNLLGYHALFMPRNNIKETRTLKSRLSLSLGEIEHVNHVLGEMFKEQIEKQQGWKGMMDAYLRYLIIYLSRRYTPSIHQEKTEAIDIANSVSYMEAHFKEDLTVEELASKSYMSTRHFSRIFNTVYHTSPCSYMILLRLQYACGLLKNSDLSISEVATYSGFNDVNYFSRQFSKKFSLTPKEYRLNSQKSLSF